MIRPSDEDIFKIIKDLLAEEGDDKLTMDGLAEKSGLSRSTLYRRFGSRKALLQRLAAEQGIEVAELAAPDIETRILEAARRLFGRVGLVAGTVEEVAQEAGVGQATVYRHFGSKEGLIRAFSDRYSPRQFVRDLVSHESGNLEQELTLFATGTLRFLYQNRDLARLILMGGEETQRLLGQIRNPSERTMTNLARYFERQIELGHLQAQSPEEMAIAFTGMLMSFGFIAPLTYGQRIDEPEETARFVVRLFLDGMSPN